MLRLTCKSHIIDDADRKILNVQFFSARVSTCVFLLASAGLAAVAPTSAAEETQRPTGVAAQVKQGLANLKKQLDADAKIDEATKDQIQASIAGTELAVNQIASAEAALQPLETASATAEQRAKSIQSQLKKLKSQDAEIIDETLKDDAIAQRLQSLKPEIESLKAELAQNEEASAARNSRTEGSQASEAIAQRVAELKKRLAETIDDASIVSQALALQLQAEIAAAELDQSRIRAQSQRDAAEQKFGLLNLQHDLVELKIQRQEQVRKQLEALQRKQLTSEAEQAYQTMVAQQNEAKQSQSLLLPSYQENTRIANETLLAENQVAQTKKIAEKLQTKVRDLNEKFRNTELRVNKIGLTGSVGALLRQRRADLLDTAGFDVLNEDAKSKIDELQYKLFEIDQNYQDLSEEVILEEVIEANEGNFAVTEEIRQTLAEEIEQVIQTRKTQLTAHKASLDRLLPRLLDVQQFDTARRRTSKGFRAYINERILWIRSNNVLFSELEIDKTDWTLANPNKWKEAGWQVVESLGFAGLGDSARSNTISNVSARGESDDATTPSGSSTKTPSAGASSVSSSFRFPLTALAAVVSLLLIFFKSKMRIEVDELGVEAARGSCVSFWPTARALVFTFLIAMAVPLVPLLLGIAIAWAPFQGSALFRAIGQSLISASLFAIPAEVLRRMTRSKGIGSMHFDWPDASVAKLKNNLDWVVLPGSLLIFVVSLIHNLDLSHRVDLLERVIFVAGMLLATYFLYRIYNAKTGVFSGYLRSNEKSWANQTSALWISLILIVPVVLAFLAFWGYYYTALNLAQCAYATLVLGLIAETTRGLARRFILVRRRNAFIQAAKRKRQARIEAAKIKREEERAAAIAAATEGGQPVPEVPSAPVESIEALTEIQPEEIEENTKQAYKLISMSLLLLWAVGIWMIWTDVLPALKALDSYTLWPNQVVENGFESAPVSAVASNDSGGDSSATDASSESASAPIPIAGMPNAGDDSVSEPIKRVTVRDLLLFIVIAVVTWIAATNLPNAFEIVFLQELPFDRSFRYAVKALTSYVIVMLGVVLAFRALSIGWANVQWLATALTFGLAFGLQEIFANFVAGIILMFERPMRIGDLITVDQFTGVVTKIRTRATTIVNWDRKEYVIPNKDFITGRLVNWTLSDAINRIEFTVGIAYGSDVELAKSTLYDILKKHPKVVDEPASQVIFNQFGDSSLNLVVKCFIGDIDSRPVVTDSLHTKINAAFNEAGIEISFPQRDLNLRSIDTGAADAIVKSAKQN